MQKFINSVIVLLTSHLCITAFAQSNTSKYLPYGIELTMKESVFNYYENDESLLPDEWEPIGPNGFAGNTIAIDPQNENILYAGGMSGLYKTTDGGTYWELADSFTINQNILDIAINPSNANILLSWFRSTFNNIMRLMHSTDSGSTWTEVLSGSGYEGSVIFDPQNAQKVFANSNGDSLYLSTNGGINWDAISSFGSVKSFVIFQQDPSILYAVSNYDNLFKTTNAGQFWELVNPQLPASFTTLKISQTNSDIIFAGNESFEGDGGFYRRTDGGEYWSHLTNGFGRSKSVSRIAVDLANPNIIYAGGYANGIFRSDDMGGQWINISESIQDNYILAITTTTNSKIYCAFGGGIYYSVNQGSTWQSLTGNLQNCDVFEVVSHPTNPDITYANSLGGVHRSYNGGMNWQLINDGLLDTDVFALTIDPINPNILYAGTFGGLIYKSNDAGDTWIEKSNGLPGLGQARIWKLTCHPNEPSWIWTGNFHIYNSTDSGENWTEFLISGERVDNIIYAPDNPDIIYAFSAISGSKLYRTTNRGVNWEVRNTFQSIDELDVDPNNSDILYASSFNIGEVVKSSDGGLTWDVVHSTSHIRGISINPQHSDYVYVATFGAGVQRSTDSGISWHNYNNGLENLASFSVKSATGEPHKLFVTTFGNSIYQINETVSSIKDGSHSTVVDFKLDQNYPNPFNPSTIISWQVPVGSWQTLKIYDVLGNEIATLVDEYKPAGTYEVEFNSHSDEGRNLTSGVYFYQLKTESFIQTKKMILLR